MRGRILGTAGQTRARKSPHDPVRTRTQTALCFDARLLLRLGKYLEAHPERIEKDFTGFSKSSAISHKLRRKSSCQGRAVSFYVFGNIGRVMAYQTAKNLLNN